MSTRPRRFFRWLRPGRRRIADLSDRDLAELWLSTGRQVRNPSTAAGAVLALVEERVLLLDELERRDPAGFQAQLVRAGWRDPHDC